MPEFLNPFQVKDSDRAMNSRELQRAIRQSISAEEEAVHLYEAYADACDDEAIKEVFQDIADEEKVHVGEFQAVLNRLSADEVEFLDEGEDEVAEMFEEKVASELIKVAKFLTGATYTLTDADIKDIADHCSDKLKQKARKSGNTALYDAAEAVRQMVAAQIKKVGKKG